ncbi:MAG: ribulose-phosphate 3-epimerase [Parcubacteria group bacterium Gr01-1014_72]|nr:MAG: ribulose-phosphate 3-epimerase [Parcubacteria group bacterium Gr01-1014_72]
MVKVIPAILVGSFKELTERLSLFRGIAETVQIDVCDGKFVPSKSWPLVGDTGEFEKMRAEKEGLPFWENFDFEIHLMVTDPRIHIVDWVKAGASRILIHAETVSSEEFSETLHEWKGVVEIGMVLNPDTSLDRLADVAHEVALVQLMGIRKVGFQGQPFEPKTSDRVREIRLKYPALSISVDGAVNKDTAPALVAAGATHLVIGSALTLSGNIKDTFEKFRGV